jgi:REP element-mobilizing transposase RayT
MKIRDWLPDFPSFKGLRQELAALYGDAVEVFAGRHHARFIPEDVPQHIISRVFQGRHLLRPGKELNNIIAGVVAKAGKEFPDVVVYAYAFLSNHIHLQLKGPSYQIADFVGYIKREITVRWGHRPDVRWRGTMWERYLSTALPTGESQVRCLKYILSHGVKEGLVSKCHLWPGVHAAKQLLSGTPLRGEWFNATRCDPILQST